MDMITQFVIQHLVASMASVIMPLMLLTFVAGSTVRILLYYYAKAENNFTLEFEKRVRHGIQAMHEDENLRIHSFQIFVNRVLQSTFQECYELRARYKRRNFDHVTSVADRLFLIQEGTDRAVKDTSRMIRYLKRGNTDHQRMMEISKNVFDSNPFYSRIIGVFPMHLMNELTNILPGLFIIGGIFGTFLGISKGLPELANMDLAKMDEAKHVMDMFLVNISQAMVKSIIGIFLSVAMSLINTFFAADVIYYNALNRFSSSLDLAWNETTTNEIDPSIDVYSPVSDISGKPNPNRRAA